MCLMILVGEVAFGCLSGIIVTTLVQLDFLQYTGLVDKEVFTTSASQLIGATFSIFQIRLVVPFWDGIG